ncbi:MULTISPECIES: DUF2490 domain-containing protein [Flavobacterium]|uniref:DUF2490 domain-containing protein n=1 Tax=Flavobacterium TaxID=237 RepID=UPI001FCB3C84|nr:MULTISPECIES: DUF2490 domain-containing protein [Flavobacterium]UOK42036.1 DUF2490 domain-containing protein [Flavobacterium enshiense]
MKRIFIIVFLTILSFYNVALAQTFDPKVDQYDAWILYTGNHKLSEKWGLHTELQWRRNEGFSEPMQNLVRFGVDYKINKTYMVTAGWAYVETFEYGELAKEMPTPRFNQYTFNEQRIWEQFVINHENVGRFQYDSRFRLEQRWLANLVNVDGNYVRPSDAYLAANPNAEDWRFRQRARYRFRVQVPLSKPEMKDNTFFFVASDEIFVNFGKHVTANIFDQNRLYLALGWRFNKDCNIQTGYMNQFIEKGDGAHKENNHTYQLALTYNLDFTKMFKKKSTEENK